MKRRYSVLKFIVFMFLFMIPVCFSDWVYLNKTASVAAANTDEVTVTIHTRQYVDDVVTDNYANKKVVSTRTETETTYSPKKVNAVITAAHEVSTQTGALVDGVQVTVVTKQEEILTKVDKGDIYWNGYKYTYTISLYEWTVETKKTNPIDKSTYSVKIAKGNTISPIELNIPGFTNYGYYSDQSFRTLFDFTKPINSNTDIYLKYYQRSSLLTQFINEKTSGTYSIYDSSRGGSKGQFDVSSDFTYDSNAGFDFLNQAVIASGVTIKFIYLDNQLFPSHKNEAIPDGDDANNNHRDAKSNVALDYYDGQYIGNNKCSVMIRLNGDLTVKGTLNIGAKVGGVNSNTHFSEIIGEYAQLDLNGHNLIIDGGTVNCYGSILDRLGGGKVIVKNGGTIQGLMTVTDAKGGNQITYGYGKGQSPFDEYRFAYIEAPIVAYYGTTIKAYLKLDIGSLGISNIYANIIGPVGSSVFSWGDKKTEDDCLEIVPYINKNLYPSSASNPTYKSIYTKMYYYRYRYNFKANVILNSQIPLNARINVKNIEKRDIAIDWARIGVPIPSFFDLQLFGNYSLTLKAKLLLLPGSSFVTMKNSNLIFNPGEEVNYEDLSIYVNLLVLKVDVYIKGEKIRNRGSLMAYDRSYYSYNYDEFNRHGYGLNVESAYWKFTKSSNHMIMGNVTIDNMPDNSYKYLISGPISISKQSINKLVTSSYVQTYDVKGSQAGSWWFSSSHSTYESSVNMITSFNALPLISNGKAYIKDNNLNIKGVFDDDTHLFTAGDQTYFLWTPNDYLIGGSDPKNQNALTDYTVTPTLVNSVIDNQIIKTNDKYYIFYKGVFVPVLDSIASGTTYTSVNASLRKFCSNNNSPLVADSPKYDSAAMNYNSTNKRWAFTKFN